MEKFKIIVSVSVSEGNAEKFIERNRAARETLNFQIEKVMQSKKPTYVTGFTKYFDPSGKFIELGFSIKKEKEV